MPKPGQANRSRLRVNPFSFYPYRQINVFVDYPGYYAGFTYYVVEPLFEKYVDHFELIGQHFRYTGSGGGVKGKPAAVSGR